MTTTRGRLGSLVPLLLLLGNAACKAPPPPSTCCTSGAEVHARDRERVRLVGVYRRVGISKAMYSPDESAPTGPTNGLLILADGTEISLERYYERAGLRSVAEGEQFDGKRVAVVGVLHRTTPERVENGHVLQSWTSPYIGEIESIALADP